MLQRYLIIRRCKTLRAVHDIHIRNTKRLRDAIVVPPRDVRVLSVDLPALVGTRGTGRIHRGGQTTALHRRSESIGIVPIACLGSLNLTGLAPWSCVADDVGGLNLVNDDPRSISRR